MRARALSSVVVLLCTSLALPGQTPPGACAVDDSAFTTRQGGCQDQTGNLVWSAKALGSWDWSHAVTYCNNLVEGGFSDWRMPTLAELQAADAHGAVGHIAGIDPLLYYLVWSSTTKGQKAWAHAFNNHTDTLIQKTSFVDLFCVRQGLPAGGPSFVGNNPLPHLRAGTVLTNGTWTTTVTAPDLALRPCFFVAGLSSGLGTTVLHTVPGVIDAGPGAFDAAGRVTLAVNLRAVGLQAAALRAFWLGLVVLEPAGPVLYDLSRGR